MKRYYILMTVRTECDVRLNVEADSEEQAQERAQFLCEDRLTLRARLLHRDVKDLDYEADLLDFEPLEVEAETEKAIPRIGDQA